MSKLQQGGFLLRRYQARWREKTNLSNVFAEEARNTIILFDKVEALFGKCSKEHDESPKDT